MPALIADQLTFGWSADKLLFDNTSLAIERERVGLLGANGSGKTALIKLLVGQLQPISGRVSLPDRWLYLAQLADPSASIAAALGIESKIEALARFEAGKAEVADYDTIGDDWDIETRAQKALTDLMVPRRRWTDPLSTLSGGQAMRARLARAKLDRPDLLILDEPTNDLDANGRDVLYQLVETWTSGLLVVSHDRTLLSKVDRILELSTLGLKSYGGAYALYAESKARDQEAAERRLLDAEKQLNSARRDAQDRRERAERRAAQGKRSKAGSIPKIVLGAVKRRAQATAGRTHELGEQQVIDAQADLEAARKDIEVRDPFAFGMPTTGLPARKRALSVKDLTISFEDGGVVLQDFSMEVVGPERVAISGQNGSGKSTLLNAIYGGIPYTGGVVRIGVERYAFLRQDLAGLSEDQTLVECFLACNPELTGNHARAALARFGFRNTEAEKLFGRLSGGERLRVSLATSLMSAEPPQLLMLDEPTNHIDLESIATLEDALNGYDGALLVVSHDRWFLESIRLDRTIRL